MGDNGHTCTPIALTTVSDNPLGYCTFRDRDLYSAYIPLCIFMRTLRTFNRCMSRARVLKAFEKSTKHNPCFMGYALLNKVSEGQYVVQCCEPFRKPACPPEQQLFLFGHTLKSDSKITPLKQLSNGHCKFERTIYTVSR